MTKYVGKDGKGNDIDLVEEDGMWYAAKVVHLMESGSFREQLEMVRNLDVRDDDILVAAFVKSGMHWLWEIVTMIQNNTVEYSKKHKQNSMLDFKSKEHIYSLPSPRILNMHFPVRWLPNQLLEKRRPIIHIMRNPKDVFVSYFNHIKAFNLLPGLDSFSSFLPMVLGENGFYLEFPWFEYELAWERFAKENPDYPILHLYYEDLKNLKADTVLQPYNGPLNNDSLLTTTLAAFGQTIGFQIRDIKRSVTQIAKFMKRDISKEMLDIIADKTDIDAMRKANTEKDACFIKDWDFRGDPALFRKGTIGDWKNWFTVAENEKMDKWLENHLVNTDLKFQYS